MDTKSCRWVRSGYDYWEICKDKPREVTIEGYRDSYKKVPEPTLWQKILDFFGKIPPYSHLKW